MIYTNLYHWYDLNHRPLPWRETCDPYAIWISEIILQQTRVAQGMDYYFRFLDHFPTVQSLSRAEEDEVLRQWQGLGYYSRARNLHKGAQLIAQLGHFPDTMDEIRLIPGVGEYTAGAILSFAFDQPYPAMDGNVYRVLSRLFNIDTPFDTTEGKRLFRSAAMSIMDTQHPRLYNSAMMELGAIHCTEHHPLCSECPLWAECMAREAGTVELLPVRKPRPALKDRYFHYTIWSDGLSTLLHRREEKDIWFHLYEFPLRETSQPETDSPSASSINLTHILSHQRIHASFQLKKVSELPQIPHTIIVKWSDLEDYALPKLTINALKRIAGL